VDGTQEAQEVESTGTDGRCGVAATVISLFIGLPMMDFSGTMGDRHSDRYTRRRASRSADLCRELRGVSWMKMLFGPRYLQRIRSVNRAL
jgi:hypothetical protein